MGEITNFKASIDWCIREETIIKILEGSYKCGDRVGGSSSLKHNITEIKPKSSDPLWTKVIDKFSKLHGEATTTSWIGKLDFVRVNNCEVALSSDSKFILQRIESIYLNQLTSIVNQVSNGGISKVILKYNNINNSFMRNYQDIVSLAG
jgi:hypothetical protein